MNALSVITSALGREVVLPNDRFDSFQLDSLEFLEFLLEVQKNLNVTIPDGQIDSLNTVQDLLDVLG